jgi:Zn-dependent M28 family amino/carboxypeptidase
VKPDERIVAVAHVQEPGANDNASGTGTLWVLAAGLAHAVRTGALTAPGRTLTFIWTDEIRGSRQWLSAYPEQAKAVQYMFSLDMTGEDTAKTGGTFLIERLVDKVEIRRRARPEALPPVPHGHSCRPLQTNSDPPGGAAYSASIP